MSERVWTAADFDYELPEELIAQVPAAERGESRLLVVSRDRRLAQGEGSAENIAAPYVARDDAFPAIIDLIPPGDLVVVNSTKVLHARFLGTRPSGARAEVLLIHPSTDDSWIAIGKPGRAMTPGRRIALSDDVSIETIEIVEDSMRRVKFVGATAAEAMNRFGRIPLPPYIAREPTPDDDRRYQTVYAAREGSVAAPTAGLHFTSALLDALRSKGVIIATLDLEVGPGTFRPMNDGDVLTHAMHTEHFEIPELLAQEVAACRARGARIWAVGTTVVRALESAASTDGTVRAGAADTKLMIVPGFPFRVVDHLVTNFHLPKSTLLMLVAAFAGHDVTMAAYRHAVEQRYRFYSYGDAMVIV